MKLNLKNKKNYFNIFLNKKQSQTDMTWHVNRVKKEGRGRENPWRYIIESITCRFGKWTGKQYVTIRVLGPQGQNSKQNVSTSAADGQHHLFNISMSHDVPLSWTSYSRLFHVPRIVGRLGVWGYYNLYWFFFKLAHKIRDIDRRVFFLKKMHKIALFID